MISNRSKIGEALALGTAFLAFGPAWSEAGKNPKDKLPKEITWKVGALNKDPLKVVGTQYDAKTKTILWTIELKRDLDVTEDVVYWAPAYRFEKRPLIRFEFQDANGILLKTVECKYLGEYVTHKGKRFGAALVIPEELWANTKIVEAVSR